MQDLNYVAPKIKGATNFTHMFICISNGRRLNNFSMRSLFFQIQLHPNFLPLISHSVWCHTQEINFNTAFSIELSKLAPLTLYDLSISFNLYWKQLQSSSLLGITTAKLNNKPHFQNRSNSLVYFYDHSPLELSVPNLSTQVGTIYVTIALGNFDDLAIIDPQKRFINAQITPINKKSAQKSLIWLQKAQENKWVSRKSIESNWMEIAIQHGWEKRQGELSMSPFEYLHIPSDSDDESIDLLNQQNNTHSDHLFKYLQPKYFDYIEPTTIVDIEPYEIPKLPIENKLKRPITIFDNFARRNYAYQYKSNKQTDSDFDSLINNYFKENPTPDLKTFKESNIRGNSSWDRNNRFSQSSPRKLIKSEPLLFRNKNKFTISSDSDDSKEIESNAFESSSYKNKSNKANTNWSLEDFVQQEFDKLSKLSSPPKYSNIENDIEQSSDLYEEQIVISQNNIDRKQHHQSSITQNRFLNSNSELMISDDVSSASCIDRSPNELVNLSINEDLNNSQMEMASDFAKTYDFSSSKRIPRRRKMQNSKTLKRNVINHRVNKQSSKENEMNGSRINPGINKIKKVPKKPIINANIPATPPPNDAPSSPKKEIIMSPSLERMINGIDSLSVQLNLSDIESDSDE